MKYSNEFKNAVAAEATRMRPKTGQDVSKDVDFLLSLLTGEVVDAYLSDIKKRAESYLCDAKDKAEGAASQARSAASQARSAANQAKEKIDVLEKETNNRKSFLDYVSADMSNLINFYTLIIEKGIDGGASSDVAVRSASYILYAYISGDKDSAWLNELDEKEEYRTPIKNKQTVKNDDVPTFNFRKRS